MTDLNERTLGVAKEYALCITSEDGKRFCIDYDGSTADSTMTPDEGALIFARCVGPRLAALTASPSVGEPCPDRAKVEEAVRADWRFGYLSCNERNLTETWAKDTETCIARTESSLKLGGRGGAGVWLDSDSLLAIRHVLEALKSAPSVGEDTRDARSREQVEAAIDKYGLNCWDDGRASQTADSDTDNARAALLALIFPALGAVTEKGEGE